MLTAALVRTTVEPFVILRGIFRFSLFFVVCFLFILHHEIAQLLIRDEEKRLKYFVKSVSWTTKLGLRILNIHVEYDVQSEQVKPGLMVCNHLSYLDILLLFPKYPALFITSKEIGNVFFLGRLTKLAGCFHIERRKHLRSEALVASELRSMKEKIQQGLSLFLFPEGTSSDGTSVLPYKAHFFQTALDLNAPITSLCLKYDWDGRHPDEICWYGDMSFASHLFKVCCRKEIKAKVVQVAIPTDVTGTRFEIAKLVETKTKEVYEKH